MTKKLTNFDHRTKARVRRGCDRRGPKDGDGPLLWIKRGVSASLPAAREAAFPQFVPFVPAPACAA